MAETKLTGSCLCGSVQYQIQGKVERFYLCHCSRCRKMTGTGHASNILVTPETCLTWTKGESLLKRFKVPDAERFYSYFCSNCGSPMPRAMPVLNGVLIPAGSLNEEPPIKPGARIFYDSRAEWSHDDSELPVFAEYPQ